MSGASTDRSIYLEPARHDRRCAPPMPTGPRLVAVTIAAERARVAAETVMTVLRFAPDNAVAARQASDALFAACVELDEQTYAYANLMECKGQA